eukprot:gnl/TRDRNA2_/TRDRNA2_44074_c0_seq1.p2 gnl/TRDRNA2_/TRDRNA2_44074_c0~~gnl/TRDRNA2_/TRDRNA2_44074_c0_seq1.p2  ORF type:complete len:104 (-),score=0.70 gnl/TRDRNA2_/TRDRNA2_44074_c0_seq1:25-336(-)
MVAESLLAVTEGLISAWLPVTSQPPDWISGNAMPIEPCSMEKDQPATARGQATSARPPAQRGPRPMRSGCADPLPGKTTLLSTQFTHHARSRCTDRAGGPEGF